MKTILEDLPLRPTVGAALIIGLALPALLVAWLEIGESDDPGLRARRLDPCGNRQGRCGDSCDDRSSTYEVPRHRVTPRQSDAGARAARAGRHTMAGDGGRFVRPGNN